MTNLDNIKKQRHYFANKGLSSQAYGFSSSHVWMWELDCKESWAPKNWCFWIVVLEKTFESPLECKEIQPVHPTGNQSWIFIWRADVEVETPILWPLDAKSWLIWKDPDVGKDWRQKEKGVKVVKMVGWHHWLNGHEFEQALGVMVKSEACCATVYRVIELALVIYFIYGNIHVSVLFSQIILPLPSPRVQKSVLYNCVRVIVIYTIRHIHILILPMMRLSL